MTYNKNDRFINYRAAAAATAGKNSDRVHWFNCCIALVQIRNYNNLLINWQTFTIIVIYLIILTENVQYEY